MSQLPPPNFVNLPVHLNGFPAWPVHGTTPSILGMPPIPPVGFPPRFPGFSPNSVSPQFGPPIWSNMYHTPNHMVIPSPNHMNAPSQRGPQNTNFQAKPNKNRENNISSVTKREFSCDACQKEFASKETLTAHLGTHVQCSYDGCSFKASRKTLKLHWIQMHASGKMRIKLDTPEEIAKWREERKRKYPTVANVEKKKEEETKRQASGQVLKNKNFRYRKGQRGGRTFHRGGLNHFNKRPHQRREQDLKNKTENGSQMSEKAQDKGNEGSQCQETKVLQNGEDPLSIVLGDCDGAESDSETKEVSLPNGSSPAFTNGTNLTTSETSVPGDNSMQLSALTSLCSAYASDSDECKEQGEINNNKETDEDLVEKPEIRKSSGPLSSKEEKKHQTKRRKRKFQRRKNKSKIDAKGDSKSVRVRKSTLLEKLLAPEIRHERNVILQCLRYIVKKNFFGVEQTDPSGQYVAEL